VREREFGFEDFVVRENKRGDHGGLLVKKTFLEPSLLSAQLVIP
jgi:hypothetical protein